MIEDSGEAGYVKHNGIGAIAVTGGKVYVSIAAKGTNMYVADAKDDKFAPLKADLPTTFVPSRINVDPNGDLLISYMAGINFEGMDGAGYRYSPKTGKTTMLLDKQGLGSVWADPENPDHPDDSKEDAYIKARINILSWAKRPQTWNLKK